MPQGDKKRPDASRRCGSFVKRLLPKVLMEDAMFAGSMVAAVGYVVRLTVRFGDGACENNFVRLVLDHFGFCAILSLL